MSLYSTHVFKFIKQSFSFMKMLLHPNFPPKKKVWDKKKFGRGEK